MAKKPFYITTTLPYVNADPHIGFALEITQADVVARYKRLQGHEVFFNTGTDENGLKIYEAATEAGVEPQAYVDDYAGRFDKLKQQLNVSYNSFIRTTDPKHIKAAQEIWKRCDAAGDIYKKKYKAKYCVGCELEKTDSELVDGCCPLHPTKELQTIEEENYFFRFSNYQGKLLELYKSDMPFVVPEKRLKEIETFVAGGLKDFSISRLKEKLPWGVPVPGDPDHVFYVWFDALVSYISCLGWPDDTKQFETFWPGMQVAGKDNLRQQTAMWQAMLLSAGLPNSTQVFIHGFITSGGHKMSKTTGNVVDPFALIEKYGTDAVRYYLLREIPPMEDGDFTIEKFEERYQADLANGLGNLVSRVAKLAEGLKIKPKSIKFNAKEYEQHIEEFKFNRALEMVWQLIAEQDKLVDEKKPWELEGKDREAVLEELFGGLAVVVDVLQPFLPDTAEKVAAVVERAHKGNLKNVEPLFPRLS